MLNLLVNLASSCPDTINFQTTLQMGADSLLGIWGQTSGARALILIFPQLAADLATSASPIDRVTPSVEKSLRDRLWAG